MSDTLTLPGTKRCTRCGEARLRGEFPVDARSRDGLRCWCGPCCREQQRESAARRRPVAAARTPGPEAGRRPRGRPRVDSPVGPCVAPGCKDPGGGRAHHGATRPARFPAEPFGRPGLVCKTCHERIMDRQRRGLTGGELWAPPMDPADVERVPSVHGILRLTDDELGAATAEQRRRHLDDLADEQPPAARLLLAMMPRAEAVRWIVRLWDRRDLGGLAAGVVRVGGRERNKEEVACSC
jgi:hypothetical protein